MMVPPRAAHAVKRRERWLRAAESEDELAPFDFITWSARPSTEWNGEAERLGGLEVEDHLALVDRCTGRSAGFSPLRIRPSVDFVPDGHASSGRCDSPSGRCRPARPPPGNRGHPCGGRRARHVVCPGRRLSVGAHDERACFRSSEASATSNHVRPPAGVPARPARARARAPACGPRAGRSPVRPSGTGIVCTTRKRDQGRRGHESVEQLELFARSSTLQLLSPAMLLLGLVAGRRRTQPEEPRRPPPARRSEPSVVAGAFAASAAGRPLSVNDGDSDVERGRAARPGIDRFGPSRSYSIAMSWPSTHPAPLRPWL